MKKMISIILIITGISLFLYPALSNLFTDYQQRKMLSEWEANSFETEAAADTFNREDADQSLEELNEVFNMKEEKQLDNATKGPDDKSVENQGSSNPGAEASKSSSQAKMNGVLGVIEIDKINLRLPVLYGASQQNLNVASGLLNGTSLPGTLGNSAIAAHRSRSFGRMFNRLDEIGSGDIVTVRAQNGTHQYEVYETLVVKPEDVSVLASSKNEKTLTLITCTPIDTATHRLIVKAKIKP